MPALPDAPLTASQVRLLRDWLRKNLGGAVSIEVWSRADDEVAAEERDSNPRGHMAVSLMRQIKAAHPAISVTPYDIDRNAAGASERGITDSPTIIMRARGRSIRCVGVFLSAIFQPFLDGLGYVSSGRSPLIPATLDRLAAIEDEVIVEAYVSAFDPISVQVIPLLGAFAVANRHLRITQIEASQFPILAGKHGVSQVPTYLINGHRFIGHYNESQLVEQIERVLAGSDEPVDRDRVWATPYVSDAEMRRQIEARVEAEAATARTAASPASGVTEPGASQQMSGR